MQIRYFSGSREKDESGRQEGVRKFPGRNRGQGNFHLHGPKHPQQHQHQQQVKHNNPAETSRHSRVTSSEGWILVFSLVFHIKNTCKITFAKIFFTKCIYVPSEAAEKTKQKLKICLVLPGYMQKLKKSIDFLKKSYIMKTARRSVRFKRLADTQNICIVYENEPNIKKLIVRTKISSN